MFTIMSSLIIIPIDALLLVRIYREDHGSLFTSVFDDGNNIHNNFALIFFDKNDSDICNINNNDSCTPILS